MISIGFKSVGKNPGVWVTPHLKWHQNISITTIKIIDTSRWHFTIVRLVDSSFEKAQVSLPLCYRGQHCVILSKLTWPVALTPKERIYIAWENDAVRRSKWVCAVDHSCRFVYIQCKSLPFGLSHLSLRLIVEHLAHSLGRENLISQNIN